MSAILDWLFDTNPLVPHGVCLLWRPDLIWTHAIADSLTAAAYLSIPFLLVQLVHMRRDMPFSGTFVLFGLFIFFCGMTHVLGVVTFWQPVYGLQAAVKVATAFASISTALVLWRNFPTVLALPSPAQLRRVNDALTAEIDVRRRAEAAYRDLNVALEERVRERAGELERANAELRAEIARRRLTEARHETENARYRAIVNTAADAIVVTDEAGVLHDFNPAAERIFGYRAEEVVGRPIGMLISEPNPEADPVQRLGQEREIAGRRKDGTAVTLELSIARWRAAGPDGGNFLTGIMRDATKRREAEAQLRQAQKMEAVGRMTGGVAHDFNNLLVVISGNIELLEEELGERDARLKRFAREALAAARRGADLTQRLLAFSRRQPLAPKTVDVNALLTGMVPMLERVLGETVAVRTALADGYVAATADPSQLEQAIMNVAINARDAMPAGGTLEIATGIATFADTDAPPGGLPAGEYAVVTIADTGTGMSPDVLARACEPFFTTKDVGKGSGLGLSMVDGFVRQSRGRLALDSKSGAGTVVALHLPRASAPAETHDRRDEAPPPPLPQRRGATVLVVEDDEQVRALAVTLIEGLGYACITAADGPQALAAVAGGAPIDLLMTDVVMPGGLDGWQLAREFRRIRPGIPVLYVSGYTDAFRNRDGQLEPGEYLLAKPYAKSDILRALQSALDGADKGP